MKKFWNERSNTQKYLLIGIPAWFIIGALFYKNKY